MYFTCGRIKHFPKNEYIFALRKGYILSVCRCFSLGVRMMLTSSVQFSHSVVSDSLRPHEPQHTRFACPSPTPGAYSNSCPSCQVMPSNHLILRCSLLFLPSIFPSIRVFSNELVLRIRCPKYWSQLQHQSFQ